MTLKQINDYVDDEPITFRTFKKTIHNGNEWEEKIFYEIKNNQRTAANWLREKYGSPKYCEAWWQTHTSIVMSEKVYTHYALCV